MAHTDAEKNHYDLGQGVTLTLTFTNETTGATVSPTGGELIILPPAASALEKPTTVDLSEMEETGEGVFEYEVVVDAPGAWDYHGNSDAPFETGDSRQFYVRESKAKQAA